MRKYNFKNMPTAMYRKVMQEQVVERRMTQDRRKVENTWIPSEDEKTYLASEYYDQNPDCTCQIAFSYHSVKSLNDLGCAMHCSHRGSIGEWCRCGAYIG